MATNDVFAMLRGVGTPKKRKEQKREDIPITRGDLNSFNNFIAARELAAKFLEIQAIANNSLCKSLYNKFVSIAWANRRRPKNPRIRTKKNNKPDNAAVFQVKNQFLGLNKFALEDNPALSLIDALVGDGGVTSLSRDVAKNFVYNEISCEPNITVRPITELSVGKTEGDEFIPSTDEEKVAVSKLIAMITAKPDKDGFIKVKGLTQDERNLIIQRENSIKVKDPVGFWRRIFSYSKNIYQFRHILDVVKPVMLFSHAQFGISDTEPEKNARLVEYTKTVFGEE
jgi:hypothetical protein